MCSLIASFQGSTVEFKVSDSFFERCSQYKWRVLKGYIATVENGKPMRLHHLIVGKPPTGYVVDHINGDRMDNRIENLRFATYSENSQNTHREKTGYYTGIHFNSKKNHWRVYCGNHYLGSFRDEVKAAEQYDKAALILYGPHAHTNGLVSYEQAKAYASIEDLKSKRQFSKETTERLNERKAERIEQAKADVKHAQKTLNCNGVAFIRVQDVEVLVDDDKWHFLMQYKWHLTNGYARAKIEGNARTVVVYFG